MKIIYPVWFLTIAELKLCPVNSQCVVNWNCLNYWENEIMLYQFPMCRQLQFHIQYRYANPSPRNKKLMKFMNSELAQNQPKWYKYTWTRVSVESIRACARTILLTFTITIACSSWITLNYNQIYITEHCPLNLEGGKLISIWYK